MTKWVPWLIAILVFIGLYLWLSAEKPVPVEIVFADRGRVEKTVTNTRAGTVTACQRARMSLPIGGQIKEILVKEGQLVEKNQLLLSLWNEDKKAKLNETKSRYAASQKNQQSSCVLADNAKKHAKRQLSLLKQKLTSQEQVDAALASADSSMASCQAAKAQTEATLATVNTMAAILEQTYLTAPFSGIVAEITGEVGEYTTPSPPGVATPPAVDLLTHDCHYITAPIDEVDAALLSVGKPVRISLDAYRGEYMTGKLRRISPYIRDYEKQARTVTVEVDFNEHKTPHLLAGYSADVEIILEAKEPVLRLASDMVINYEHVLVLNSENIIEQRQVKVGLSNWQYSEILSGLTKTDRVITSIGRSEVKPGVKAVASKGSNK